MLLKNSIDHQILNFDKLNIYFKYNNTISINRKNIDNIRCYFLSSFFEVLYLNYWSDLNDIMCSDRLIFLNNNKVYEIDFIFYEGKDICTILIKNKLNNKIYFKKNLLVNYAILIRQINIICNNLVRSKIY